MSSSVLLMLLLVFFYNTAYGYFLFPVMPPVDEISYTLVDEVPSDTPVEIPRKNYLAALVWMAGSNISLFCFNRFVMDAEYAQVTPQTIGDNLRGPWVWDQDEFTVNHLGHPYQGSTYFISGKVNGLSFFESALLTAGGSVSWELFCENESPSYNDFIATTLGGVQVGEMLHRLYMEADPLNSIFSFVVSPVDFIENRYSKKEMVMRKYRKVQVLDLSLYTSNVFSSVTFRDEQREDDQSEHPYIFGGAMDIVYGKSYGLDTKTPFENFEVSANVGAGQDYYQAILFSDAFLFSVNPFTAGRFKTSLGMSMHYDVLYTNEIMYSGNAVGFSAKQSISLPRRNSLFWATHLNWLILGSSDYYYFVSGEIEEPQNGEERRNYDLGTGGNTKLMLGYANPLIGSLGFSYVFSAMKTIPGSVPDEGSAGYTIIGMGQGWYEHKLWRNFWLGISNNFYHKQGYYSDAINLNHYADYGSLYLKIKF